MHTVTTGRPAERIARQCRNGKPAADPCLFQSVWLFRPHGLVCAYRSALERPPDETPLAGLSDSDEEVPVMFVPSRFQRKVYAVTVSVLGDSRLAEDAAQQSIGPAASQPPPRARGRGRPGANCTTPTSTRWSPRPTSAGPSTCGPGASVSGTTAIPARVIFSPRTKLARAAADHRSTGAGQLGGR